MKNFLTWFRSQAPLWIPKPRRGEYVWKATVYRFKILNTAEDTPLHVERFFVEREAKDWKRATEVGIHKNTVKITKVLIADDEGYIG